MANRGMKETWDHVTVRFWSKVQKASKSDCWPWLAGIDKDGYGLIRVYRRTERASRVSMMIEHGHIPDGSWVLHNCDNPICVNPDHLRFGTASENSLDRERRHRGRPQNGENNPMSKLTKSEVDEIKQLYIPSRKHSKNRIGPTQKQLSIRFRVNRALISMIVNGKIWVTT